MDNIYIIPIFSIFFYLLNFFFVKNKFLIDKIETSKHKKFMKIKNVPLSGGILFLLFVLFFFRDLDNVDYLFLFLIFVVGLLSDVNIINSPTKRLILQLLFLVLYVSIKETFINYTRVFFIDDLLLYNDLFKIIFTVICLIILLNGINFIDGSNLLAGGYVISVLLGLSIFTGFEDDTFLKENILKSINFLLVFLSFNFFSKSFLGDSGSYLISIVLGFICINFANYYINTISPFFIALLLWYPALENLFSIIRRVFLEKKPISSADNLHLHHVVNIFISRYIKNNKINNPITGLLLNSSIFIFILIGIIYANQTKVLLCLILFKSIIYIATYYFLKKKILRI